jgi:protease-4
MGDFAASGGYFIASQADSIFALPNTITGSIGVFSMMFNVGLMMHDKLGVNFDGVKNAPYADFPNAFRPLTIDEAKRMQTAVDTIYSLFKGHVITGRHLPVNKVEEIAQGRVWTGADALKNGLVDDLGGLGRAIKSAAAKASLKDYKVVTYPEPFDKFSAFIKKLKNNGASEEIIKAAMKEQTGAGYEWYERLDSYRKMSGKTMMEMPFTMDIQ